MSRPTTNVGDSPTGFEFGLKLPQNEDPYGLAEAHLRDLRVLLPEGLTVNPASADGLGACSPQQIGLVTPSARCRQSSTARTQPARIRRNWAR